MNKRHINRLKLKHISDSITGKELFDGALLGSKIRDTRQVIGMSQTQLAKRIGVSQQEIAKIEKHAASSSINTIEKILSALDIKLMLALTCPESLEQKLMRRAMEKAKRLIAKTNANMAMELQHPGDKNYDKRLRDLAEEIAQDPDSSLWDDI